MSVGLLCIIGLVALNRFGISALNRLPVTSYALTPEAAKLLTPAYSYALTMNFRPNDNYQADIASAVLPMEVLVGGDDDQSYAERFATEFSSTGCAVPVSILPGTGHIEMTPDSAAIEKDKIHWISSVRHSSSRELWSIKKEQMTR